MVPSAGAMRGGYDQVSRAIGQSKLRQVALPQGYFTAILAASEPERTT